MENSKCNNTELENEVKILKNDYNKQINKLELKIFKN